MNTDNSPDLDKIAAAWMAYQQWAAARPSQDSSRRRTLAEFADEDAESERNGFWAWDAVDSLVHKQPEQAWILILKLVELSNDDGMLATVAAGPLEDLLGSHPHDLRGLLLRAREGGPANQHGRVTRNGPDEGVL